MKNPALAHTYLSAARALLELAANLQKQGMLNQARLRAREAARRALDAAKHGAGDDVVAVYQRATSLAIACAT